MAVFLSRILVAFLEGGIWINTNNTSLTRNGLKTDEVQTDDDDGHFRGHPEGHQSGHFQLKWSKRTKIQGKKQKILLISTADFSSIIDY